MSKVITRTIKSSIVTVYGLNPATFDKVEKKITVLGNFSEMSEKEKEKVKNDTKADDFFPALIVDKGEYSEKKIAMDINDFIKYGHEMKDGEEEV